MAGSVSPCAIDSGMFQYGLNTTVSISSLKIGVFVADLADDDANVHHGLAFFARDQVEVRNVHHEVAVAEIVRHPAPALEVQRDLADALSSGTFNAASVVLIQDPGGFDRVELLERLHRGFDVRVVVASLAAGSPLR